MKLNFYVRFLTRFGESLSICGNIDELGNDDPVAALPMQYVNQDFWSVSITPATNQLGKLRYRYIFTREDGSQIHDAGTDRIIDLSKSGVEELEMIDHWNHQGLVENVFY